MVAPIIQFHPNHPNIVVHRDFLGCGSGFGGATTSIASGKEAFGEMK